MVNYTVLISADAKQKLREIYQYLKEKESLSLAIKVRDALITEINGLDQMPERHGLAKEIRNKHIQFRRVLKWNYKIVFAIFEERCEVFVVDIVHAKQNPQILQDKLGD